jgi:hypothetical protein
MSAFAVLPRAVLREHAIRASVGHPIESDIVAIMAESLLDALDEVIESESVHDDAVDLPIFVKDLARERTEAIEEENTTIRDLKADVERLEAENDKLGDAIADLEKQLAATFSGEKMETLTRERDAATLERDAAREETRDLRKRVLAVATEDGGTLCRLPGCYNEAHSSDGRCTFHRGENETPKTSPEPKKRTRRKTP